MDQEPEPAKPDDQPASPAKTNNKSGKASFTHHNAATKARVVAVYQFLRDTGLLGTGSKLTKSEIFRQAGVSHSAGHRILREFDESILDPETTLQKTPETRGRKRLLDNEALRHIERCIEQGVFDGRTIPWEEIPAAAGLDIHVSGVTVRRALGQLDYRRCVTCDKQYRSKTSKEARVNYARTMLEKYPRKEDWYHVRFSDEMHIEWGPKGEIWAPRRPWEIQCADCVADTDEPAQRDGKRLYCWAAVGYNFKSELVWYDVPKTNNGKTTMQVYRDEILEPVVGEWLRQGHSFVLEEDNDCGHGGKKRESMTNKWKIAHGLQSFFNPPLSPDFVPIEKALQFTKQFVKRRPGGGDDSAVKGLVEEGWATLRQESINNWVDQIPQILRDCIEREGERPIMTGYW